MSNNIQGSKSIKILLMALIIGILFDVLIFDKALGVSYPLFITAFYISFFCLLDKPSKYNKSLYLWLVPIALLSMTYFIHSNMIFHVLNFIAIPILITIHTILTAKKNKHKWYSKEFVGEALLDTVVYPFVNMGAGFKTTAAIAKMKSSNEKYNTMKKVVVGLAISLPLVILLILLLSSADAVFKHYVGEIPNMIFGTDPIEFIARLILVIIVALYVFGYLYELIMVKREEHMPAKKESKAFSLDAVISITVLCAINLIYILFVFIQFSYLFGGAQALLPETYTYAEYARKGFFELVIVTIINLSILVTGIKLISKDSLILYRAVKLLLFMLVACTLVMLVSAFTRLSLYEQVYGYTYLRVLVHSFMIYLFGLFASAIYKLIRDRESLLRLFVIISVLAFTILNYVNIDVLIARKNIERYQQSNKIDVYYFANLSYDAVEYMIPLLQDKDQQKAAVIEGILYDKRKNLIENQNWQSLNISKEKAWSLLKDLKLSPKNYHRGDTFDSMD